MKGKCHWCTHCGDVTGDRDHARKGPDRTGAQVGFRRVSVAAANLANLGSQERTAQRTKAMLYLLRGNSVTNF